MRFSQKGRLDWKTMVRRYLTKVLSWTILDASQVSHPLVVALLEAQSQTHYNPDPLES